MQVNQERKIFLLLAGSTSVSKIPGITAAGATPELSFLTPAVDAEILTEGRPLSMNDPPMTPDGIPTPSIITRACLKVASLWPLVINAGMAHKPGSMFMETGLEPAGNPVNGEALPQLDRAIKTGIEIGKFLSRTFSDLYIAESVPGGTTTAYLVLRAMGYSVETSSSLKMGSDDIKEDLWHTLTSGKETRKLSPLDAVRRYGDYMMALALGLSRGASGSRLHYCGGTQMATVFELDRTINNPTAGRDVITTGWVIDHKPDTMKKLVRDQNLVRTDISFHDSPFEGLRKYDEGHVREGAGMGGSYYLASTVSGRKEIMEEINSVYGELAQIR
jgi:uncharacterized protein (TIGR00303 family)